ncbi:MAG: hypothetical protein K2L99_03770, partial [Muribaculaceae bacterium]|nr:hypothetical protein [Muribaculaceae bacterium]
VKYIDMTGCKFTESSKQFVNKYLTEVSDRMYESLEEIKNLMHLMAFGKLSDKNMNKAQNALTKAAQKLSTYQGIMKELFQLQKSDQVYDISISREYSDARDLRNDHAIAYDRDGAKYNSENGIFEIKLHKNDLGDIAHELKHAYQFENGQISYYDTSMDRTSVTFYDLTDEEEAFQRGALFGQRIDAPVRNIYPNLPTDKRELSPEQKKYLYILQPFSNKKNIIFRWGGKTYRPQN